VLRTDFKEFSLTRSELLAAAAEWAHARMGPYPAIGQCVYRAVADTRDDATAAQAAAAAVQSVANATAEAAVAFGVSAGGAKPAPPAKRFTARFDPQAWVGDYAFSVDPEGDTVWDATAAVLEAAEDGVEYFQDLIAGRASDEVLDDQDVLRGDTAAPEWVRNWSGPFSIWVTAAKPPSPQ
jgi:hypothetical protein